MQWIRRARKRVPMGGERTLCTTDKLHSAYDKLRILQSP